MQTNICVQWSPKHCGLWDMEWFLFSFLRKCENLEILNCDNCNTFLLSSNVQGNFQNSNWHKNKRRRQSFNWFLAATVFTWRKDLNSQRDLNLLGLLSMITQTGLPHPLNTGNLKLAEVPWVAKVYIIIINQNYHRHLTVLGKILWF